MLESRPVKLLDAGLGRFVEKRRHPRFPIGGFNGTLKTPGDVTVLNLSRRGIAFETPHRITPGERYYLELRFQEQAANMEVLIKWCSVREPEPGEDDDADFISWAGGSVLDVFRESEGGIWDLVEPEKAGSAPA